MDNNNEVSVNDEQQDLLAEEFQTDNHFVYATQGQRFLNWLIDNVVLRLTLSYLISEGLGYLLGSLFPEFLRRDKIIGKKGIKILLAGSKTRGLISSDFCFDNFY